MIWVLAFSIVLLSIIFGIGECVRLAYSTDYASTVKGGE